MYFRHNAIASPMVQYSRAVRARASREDLVRHEPDAKDMLLALESKRCPVYPMAAASDERRTARGSNVKILNEAVQAPQGWLRYTEARGWNQTP